MLHEPTFLEEFKHLPLGTVLIAQYLPSEKETAVDVAHETPNSFIVETPEQISVWRKPERDIPYNHKDW